MTGIQILIGGALITLGALNLAGATGDVTGGLAGGGAETNLPADSPDTRPPVGDAVREVSNPPRRC